ncbi:hypothetical protein [Fodinibius halophilus]|uniref:Uncharacterized protein n=1 Tax=Fodinibius halophilus TaxID=1736908 RepID=A0A6M1T1A5_9BACT|nr:hypothetical protein [Fodinibius halophilus]NGP86965.1 hypothetical protein [Fodinibius halophilus]
MHRILLWTLVTGLLWGTLSTCKSPNGPDDDDTEMIEKTITPTDGSSTLDNATLYNADTDEKLGVGEKSLKREKGTKLSVRAEQDGYHSETKPVSFLTNGSVEIVLTEENPDEVTLNYRIADKKDVLISSAELFIADTLAKSQPEGSITLPYQEAEVDICGRAEYYEESCKTVTLDESRELSLQSARKTVTYTITPEIYDADGKIVSQEEREQIGFHLEVGDSTVTDSLIYSEEIPDYRLNYPMSNKTVIVSGDGIYNLREDLSTKMLSRGNAEVSAANNQDITLKLKHVPACSDGIDNDGDSDIDREDSGCVDSGGNYDPEDDVELVEGLRRTGYATPSSKGYVSSKEGNREVFIGAPDYPNSIKKALSVEIYVEHKLEADQSNEAFAFKFACGPDENNRDNINMTNIISDDPDVDGWHNPAITGITKDFFATGTNCSIRAVHASKVRGEAPGDGGDDVVFYLPDETRELTTVWFYEPEEVESSN